DLFAARGPARHFGFHQQHLARSAYEAFLLPFDSPGSSPLPGDSAITIASARRRAARPRAEAADGQSDRKPYARDVDEERERPNRRQRPLRGVREIERPQRPHASN